MYKMTMADLIWNRACGESPLRVLVGDRALADLLQAHGLAMNGGVFHAIDCLTATELSDAKAGYRFFGLDSVAEMLSRAKEILKADDDLDSYESQLDREYMDIIPDDSFLVELFEKHLKTNPLDFETPRERDLG